ncbi:spm1 protein, possible [Cryptosporidium felis]|nr:spm1 protein, possible [Cryptosporidium felis]
MRDINFSSGSSDNLMRSSAQREQLQEQNRILFPSPYLNSNSTVHDYRFLPKLVNGAESSTHLTSTSRPRSNLDWKRPNFGLIKATEGLGKSLIKDSRNLGIEKPSQRGYEFPVTPISQVSSVEPSIRNEIPSINYKQLPLLPPNRLTYFEAKNTGKTYPDTTRHVSVGRSNCGAQTEAQSCRKRSLQQVYKHKSEQIDEEEFFDAISDEEDDKSDPFINSNKRVGTLPPHKKTYSQTPSTVAQTVTLGTQTNTPNKINGYGLPLSFIEDDFRPSQTPVYDFSTDKLQDIQKQSSAVGIPQYSHPYNFPKAHQIPPNTDSISKQAPSSIQRIRTPLRYRSSLLGALSNKPDSSCKILSAAEMKKVFCRSKKPIGSLKDFVHTVEIRKEIVEPKLNFNFSRILDEKPNNDFMLEMEFEEAFQSGEITEPEITNEKLFTAKDENDPQPLNIDSLGNDYLKIIDKVDSVEEQHTANDSSLRSSGNLLETSEQNSLACANAPNSEIDTSDINDTIRKEKEDSHETDQISKDTPPEDKDTEQSEPKRDQAVPWWLANVDKPNLVEVDNDGVFLTDEDEDSKVEGEEKPPISPVGLFSLPVADNSNSPKKENSLFSFASTAPASGISGTSTDSLFGPSLFQTKMIEKSSPKSYQLDVSTQSPKISQSLSSIFVSKANNDNSAGSVSLFGVKPKEFEDNSATNTTENSTSKLNSETVQIASPFTLKPEQPLFAKPSPDETGKLQENSGITKASESNSDSLLNSAFPISSGGLFSQKVPDVNQLFGTSPSTSTQNLFGPSKAFDITKSDDAPLGTVHEKGNNSIPIFESKDLEGKDTVGTASAVPPTSKDSNSSDLNALNSSAEPQKNTQSGLFGDQFFNFQGSSGLATSIGTSIFGSITEDGSQNRVNPMFGTQNSDGFVQGLSTVTSSPITSGLQSTTGVGSIFGIRPVQPSSPDPAPSLMSFSTNNGVSSGNSIPSQVSNNLFSQTPSVIVENNSSSPFIFGSNPNKPQDLLFSRPPKAAEQVENPPLFGSQQGLFNPPNKPEANMFQGTSGILSTTLGSNTQTTGQPSADTNLFGSTPQNLLGASPLIGSNVSNPFVGHSSNPVGGTSHRRRIARAKRSH